MIPKLNERRMRARVTECPQYRLPNPLRYPKAFFSARVTCGFQGRSKLFQARVCIGLVEAPNPSPVRSFSGPCTKPAVGPAALFVDCNC